MEPLLKDALPELAEELASLLRGQEESALAEQISQLRLFDRCRCGDGFCATVYTAPKPAGAWGSEHRNVPLDPTSGFLILDVVKTEIVCVEVLYRDEMRDQVLRLLP